MSRDAMKVLTSLPPGLAEVEPLSGELDGMDQPIRVLITDDEALNRRLLRRYLERAGMEVIEAVDGVQALQILADTDSNLDVVILDLLMPGLRGEEVLARMRADARFRRRAKSVRLSLALSRLRPEPRRLASQTIAGRSRRVSEARPVVRFFGRQVHRGAAHAP